MARLPRAGRAAGRAAVGVAADARARARADARARGRAGGRRLLLYDPERPNPTGATADTARRAEIYRCAARRHRHRRGRPVLLDRDARARRGGRGGRLAPTRAGARRRRRRGDAAGARDAAAAKPPRSYLSLDTDGRVVRLDSFAKFVSPGLRVGFVSAPPAFLEKFKVLQETSAQFPSGVAQAALLGLLRCWGRDGLDAHLRALQRSYTARRAALLSAPPTRSAKTARSSASRAAAAAAHDGTRGGTLLATWSAPRRACSCGSTRPPSPTRARSPTSSSPRASRSSREAAAARRRRLRGPAPDLRRRARGRHGTARSGSRPCCAPLATGRRRARPAGRGEAGSRNARDAGRPMVPPGRVRGSGRGFAGLC